MPTSERTRRPVSRLTSAVVIGSMLTVVLAFLLPGAALTYGLCFGAAVLAVPAMLVLVSRRAGTAVVIGFNVKPVGKAASVAESEGVRIEQYKVIYNATEAVTEMMIDLLEPAPEPDPVSMWPQTMGWLWLGLILLVLIVSTKCMSSDAASAAATTPA